MKQPLTLALAGTLLLLWCPIVGTAQETSQSSPKEYPKAVLSQPYTPMLGDMIALSMSELVIALKGSLDAPTVAIYDRDAKKITVLVYGSRSTLDGAKSSLDDTRKLLQTRVTIAAAVYHATVSENDLAFIYYHNQKELVRWEDGKYTVGAE